ncbi:uncharacterized protein B0P05DRAFT_547415 [Gilbertella persicaria]|uniref:uncharacterized protein n=1 Tax=Gilbertella persicaria TaxID=101096 RepID=UPI00221F50D0|nr:uncharacterized protein B0P05DRAFT_547415 [Gilbertella persicaria]KAI8075412.1 hypothetical protein B0P05DRAFT_547415 [Gilbertella persicaria]
MDRLPKEIIYMIIKDFSFEQKLTMASVCKSWHKATHRCILYDKIAFYGTQDQLIQTVESFKTKGLQAQVTEFTIHCDDITLSLVLGLPMQFPHIKTFHVKSRMDIYIDTFSMRGPNRVNLENQWTSIKKSRKINTDIGIWSYLLESPHQPGRTTLSLGVHHGTLPDAFFQTALPYFSHLRLEKITIDQVELGYDVVERLHKALTDISCVSFHNVSLDDSDTMMLVPTTKANTTQLMLKGLFSDATHPIDREELLNEWILYIAEKYPHLTSLTMIGTTLMESVFARNFFSLIQIAEQCHRLKHLDIHSCAFISPVFRAMQKHGIQLESLTLYLENDADSSQLEALATSTQTRYLKKLRIDEQRLLCKRGGPGETGLFDALKSLIHLEELVMQSRHVYRHDPLFLMDILNHAPHLQSLEMSGLERGIDGPAAEYATEALPTVQHTLRLKHLKIGLLQFNVVHSIEPTNHMLKSILSASPELITFECKANIYHRAGSDKSRRLHTKSLELCFESNPALTSILVESLYRCYFKINNKTYQQEYRTALKAVPEIPKQEPYIAIKSIHPSMIRTSIVTVYKTIRTISSKPSRYI